mmetsp:Transcript_16390/g.51520  ORF Transcript_16390/g.51520 Transcript_16390/m.51520 type:complete len:226 (+) Transcript_16390:201-878(+)
MLKPMQKLAVPTLQQMVEDVRVRKTPLFGAVYAWLSAKVGEELEVMPGEEFRVASEEAHAIGAAVMLGDRDVRITLKRVWAALGAWEKVRFIWTLVVTGLELPSGEDLKSLIEEMKNSDVLTEAIKEMARSFPSLLRPLIYERDEFLVVTTKLAATSMPSVSRVVAVVGAGHVEGMVANWEQWENIDIVGISTLPRKKTWGWGAAAVVAAGAVGVTVIVLKRWKK